MADVRTLSTDDRRQRLEQGNAPQLWNVLTSRHFTGELIPGSRRVPLDTIKQQGTAVPKDTEMIHERVGTGGSGETCTTVAIHELLLRIQGEYREMPGLSLTASQAARLWALDSNTCTFALATLIERRILRRTPTGAYVRGECLAKARND